MKTVRTSFGTASRCSRSRSLRPRIGLRRQRERDSGRREQHQVDDERKTERRRRVVGDHPGDQRPQAEAAEVDDDRDQAGEPLAVSWDEVDEGGRRRSREDARGEPGQDPPA